MGRRIEGYLFVAFPLAVVTVFILIPTAAGILLSFFNWNGGPLWTSESGWELPTWVGLANYETLLGDPDIANGLRNTLVFTFASVPPSVLIAFLLAAAVNSDWFRGKAVVRTLLFMPTIVSIVAAGLVWQLLLKEDGLLDEMLAWLRVEWVVTQFGGTMPRWLIDDPWPMTWIVIVQIWRSIGFSVLLYMAAMTAIPKSLYEAAEIDGASAWDRLRHVTWPQVKPMTIFLTVTGVITALQVFDLVFIMMNETGTPGTTVLNLSVYEQFNLRSYGYASAIGVLIFAVTAVATFVQIVVGRSSEGGR